MNDFDYSSEKQRRHREKKRRRACDRRACDRRSFKDLSIHETIPCPVDPDTLPPDAVRVEDEMVIVQDIEIKLCNIRFQHVYYSVEPKTFSRTVARDPHRATSVPTCGR